MISAWRRFSVLRLRQKNGAKRKLCVFLFANIQNRTVATSKSHAWNANNFNSRIALILRIGAGRAIDDEQSLNSLQHRLLATKNLTLSFLCANFSKVCLTYHVSNMLLSSNAWNGLSVTDFIQNANPVAFVLSWSLFNVIVNYCFSCHGAGVRLRITTRA